MPYHLFQYALPGPSDLTDLNAFLGSRRVVSVEKEFISTPTGGLLVFLVHTVEAAVAEEARKATRKIDYKLELSPAEFECFSRLREERKRLADAEGVPVYTLFSNEQLAEMVRRPVKNPADLAAIPGIGKGRLDKYGVRLLAILNQTEATEPVKAETKE